MKRVYPLITAACLYLSAFTALNSSAQCTCWTGNPATAVVNTFTLPPTALSSAVLTFPQLNPAIGTISCMKLDFNMSASSTTTATNGAPSTALLPTTDPNYSPTGRLQYIFSLLTAANITGPGISYSMPYYTVYGPDSLGAAGQPDDVITYGPTNVIPGVSGSQTISPSAVYYGTGNATMSYSISGGLNTIKGGLNFTQQIQTTIWGTFTLTYYWCPAQPLATGITNFLAIPNGQSIQLQWQSPNEQNNTNYEIQTSQDGKTFTTIGDLESNPASAGTAAKYQYQYNPDQAYVGKIYFRIKVTDASGHVTWSPVLVADPNGSQSDKDPVTYQTYPNPAKDNITLQFNRNLTGRYLLELVNTAGQTVDRQVTTLTGTSQISMGLSPHPRGLYFLRTTDLTHNQHSVSKVLLDN